MKKLPYNQSTFSSRLQTTVKYLERRQRRGNGQLLLAVVNPGTWSKLIQPKPLDGLSLYTTYVEQVARHTHQYHVSGRMSMSMR